MNKENQTGAESFKVSRREILAAGGAALIRATLFSLPFDFTVSGQGEIGR